jgi:preprotein translocase YajC subunit
MHFINNASYLVAATASKAKTTNSGSPVFLVLLVIIGLMYFLVMRPNQKRRMAAMRQSRTFDVGDEVVAGGMVGRVKRMDETMVDIEVSDGVVVKFVPQAVQLRSAYLAAQARTYGGRNAARAGAAGRAGSTGTGSTATGSTGTGSTGTGSTGTGSTSEPVVDVTGAGGDGFQDEYGTTTEVPPAEAYPETGAVPAPPAVTVAQAPNADGTVPTGGILPTGGTVPTNGER